MGDVDYFLGVGSMGIGGGDCRVEERTFGDFVCRR